MANIRNRLDLPILSLGSDGGCVAARPKFEHSEPLGIERVSEPPNRAAYPRLSLGTKIAVHDLVFPNLAGKPMSNTNLLQRGFYPALRRGGLRKIRFHDLRHTFASLLIANGEDIVRVSRLLGHSSPTVTLNVYAHMLPNEHYGSAERLKELVFGDQAAAPARDTTS